ncbi:MAG: hypothetical protein ACLQVD_03550 [Capsulimonadaceae bacterium]
MSSSTWLTLDYSPGFVEDIMLWHMTVDISGEVTHHVRVRQKNAENRWTVTAEH